MNRLSRRSVLYVAGGFLWFRYNCFTLIHYLSPQFGVGTEGKKQEPESNVLLASIEEMQFAVSIDVLHTVVSLIPLMLNFPW